MIIIHDKRIPKEAIATLNKYGESLPFFAENTTCEEIAGHPDLFFSPTKKHLVIAPNTPRYFIDFLKNKGFSIIIGSTFVGKEKNNSTCYNVVISDNYIIHNQKYTDSAILKNISEKKFIHVNQAYTRCSLLALKEDNFITSDKGIEKELLKQGLNCLYLSPKEILLPGFANGFVGGCMGTYKNRVFIIGNPDFHSEGKQLQAFLHGMNYEIISLYNGRLFDGGSLFFLE